MIASRTDCMFQSAFALASERTSHVGKHVPGMRFNPRSLSRANEGKALIIQL